MSAVEAGVAAAPASHAGSATLDRSDDFPTASTSKHPFDPSASGPAFPSTFAPNQSRHSRRPSRAERYEAIVSSAREVLARGSSRRLSSDSATVGLGLSSSGTTTGREGKRRSRLDEVVADAAVGRVEWEDTVRSLLRVVDGMGQQLASHDDLAAQLKIAQSNLALAETHSEFLEDTLRRRESVSAGSHAMSRHRSGPGSQRRGSADNGESSGLGGLFGLGLSSSDVDASSGAKSFFRLPSKRKPAASQASSTSTPGMNGHGLRSVASSPLLNDVSPNPTSPTDPPRFSTSTFSSVDGSALPVPVNGSSPSPAFSREVFTLQTQVSSLETECVALRSNNASLTHSNETLVGRCAELQKTTEDLMSELENLSVELFSEANALVADERKARAKAEEDVERLQGEVASLTAQLSTLRQELAHRPPFLDVSSPALPALPHSAPATPAMPMSADSLKPISASPGRMASPAPADLDVDRPVSAIHSRRWFPFSRAPILPVDSGEAAPASTAAVPGGTLQAPAIAWGDSTSSHNPDASAANSFPSSAGSTHSTLPTLERSPVLPASLERNAASLGGKGKEKARELDLGIYLPAGPDGAWMTRSESDSGTTIGAKSPTGAALPHQPLDAAVRRPASPEARSPGLVPRLPHPTSIPMDAASAAPSLSLSSAQAEATPIPDPATPVFAGPRLRPPRSGDGPPAPRPLAIHTDVTPPMLAGGFTHPIDSSRIGGPTAAEMTAASKSPKSPNELRWNKIAGSLDSNGASSTRPRSNSRSSMERSGEGDRWDREKMPPSPALPDGFEPTTHSSAPTSTRQPHEEVALKPAEQEQPEARPSVSAAVSAPGPASITARLRVDTSVARPGVSVTGGTGPLRSSPARAPVPLPTAAGSRPTTTRSASATDAVPWSTASSGPENSSARPTLSRAQSHAAPLRPSGGGGGGGRGIAPSTSASSLASRSSASSGAALLSPDGTRAVEDLDSLMRSIVEMSAGLFDQEEEGMDGDRRDSVGLEQAARP